MEQLNLSWLRQARRRKKMSLEKAASIVGKNRSTMFRYENGKTPLTIDTLLQLLNSYGVSIMDVIAVKEDDNDETV